MSIGDTVVLIIGLIAFMCGVVIMFRRNLDHAEKMAKVMQKLQRHNGDPHGS